MLFNLVFKSFINFLIKKRTIENPRKFVVLINLLNAIDLKRDSKKFDAHIFTHGNKPISVLADVPSVSGQSLIWYSIVTESH